MRVIPYKVSLDSVKTLKNSKIYGVVGVNFESLNDLYASIYSNNLIVRNEAKIFVKLLPILRRNAKLVFYGLNRYKKAKLLDKLVENRVHMILSSVRAKHNNFLTKTPQSLTKVLLSKRAKFALEVALNKLKQCKADIILIPSYLL